MQMLSKISLAVLTFAYVALDGVCCVEGAAVVQPHIVVNHELDDVPEPVVGDDGAVLVRVTVVRLALKPGMPRGCGHRGQRAVRPLPCALCE